MKPQHLYLGLVLAAGVATQLATGNDGVEFNGELPPTPQRVAQSFDASYEDNLSNAEIPDHYLATKQSSF